MQHKWMFLLSAVVVLSLVIAPAGTVQAQADMQATSPDCPPYRPDRLRDKESVRSLPQDCIQSYREMDRQDSLAARDAGPAMISDPDSFGYTYNDAVPFSWVSATTNSGLTGDDAFTGPINIGFNFPFYGVAQSQLYISTNGLITFGAGSSAHTPEVIPHAINPNNFIAAFWDDLLVGPPYNSGGIYYSQGGSAPNRYFVLEWRNIENDMGEGSFSFGAILYENGNILVQHQSVPSQFFSVVGIEDLYGEQGLEYSSWGIGAGSAILFSYPTTPTARISAHPLQSGKFTSPGSKVDFEILVTNTGTMGTDRYDLTSTGSAWPVAYYAANGSALLTDTDGDSFVDTGPISAGSSTRIIARYHTPTQAIEGHGNSAHIQLTSSLNNAVTTSVHLGMGISSGFATVFQDESDGAMSFLTASKDGTTLRKVTTDGHGGTEPAVARFSNGNYLYVWDTFRGDFTKDVWNVEYALLGPNGTIILPPTTLVDHSSATIDTYDVSPSIAVAPDGTVGIAWYRYLYNRATEQSNYNIFFATLNASGTRLTGPTNITNNTVWGTWSDYQKPELLDPSIAATSDNRFIISWTDVRYDASFNIKENIWYAVYNTAGASVKSPTALTTDNTSRNPVLNSLTNGRGIVVWGNDVPYEDVLHYAVLNSSGGIVKSSTPLHFGGENYAIAWQDDYDAVLLPNGKVAVAWINGTGVEFAILSSSYDLESGPYAGNDDTHGYGMSVITNASGQIIMTWVADYYKLSYAVADSSGAYLTDPMVYYTNREYIHMNWNGQGSAPFTFSPVTTPTPTFSDVETDHWAWQFVERLVQAGVTAGCGQGNYCPDAPVTRDQMAVFLLKAKHGKSYTPPAVGSSTGFTDVPPGHWAAAWIKQLAAEGITGGCGQGNYCPGAPVTRDQMAVFLLKARHGKSYSPPAVGSSTGFTDVPPEHWAAAWIKRLAAEGITGGCGSGNYCPGNPVNRAEMAVFLVRTFNLP